jgi:PKD repeat protein
VADFEWSNSGGTRVKFRSLADGEAIHFWLFGDGEEDFGRNPMHRYDQAGTYRVTLFVTWLDGEMERETKDVTVE